MDTYDFQKIRQRSVRNLEPASFQHEHGFTDIAVLKQGIYDAADSAGVFAVICLQDDLAKYQLVWQDVLQHPGPLDPVATGNAMKIHTILSATFNRLLLW